MHCVGVVNLSADCIGKAEREVQSTVVAVDVETAGVRRNQGSDHINVIIVDISVFVHILELGCARECGLTVRNEGLDAFRIVYN